MHISASCTVHDKTLTSEHTVPLSKDIAVYEFFDERFLSQVWTGQSITCSFKFTAENSSGSKHVFPLQGVQITDAAKHNIQITMENTSADINIVFGLDRRVQFKMWGSDYDALVMQCEDARWISADLGTEVPFTRVVANGPEKDPADPDHKAFLKRPTQMCRLLTYSRNRINAVSPSFFYAMQIGAPEVKVLRGGKADLRNLRFPLARVEITNTMDFPVKVQILS